jgi:hypothetical protein
MVQIPFRFPSPHLCIYVAHLDNYPFFDLFSSIFSLFFHLHVFHCFMVFPFYDCLFFDLFILASYSSYPFFYTQKGRTDGACRGGSRKSRLLREPCIPPSRSRTRPSIQSQGSSRRRPHRVTDVAAPPSHKKKRGEAWRHGNEQLGGDVWSRWMDGWTRACKKGIMPCQGNGRVDFTASSRVPRSGGLRQALRCLSMRPSDWSLAR